MPDLTALYFQLMCPRCEARPGEECRSVTGQRAAIHGARHAPIDRAYVQGYKDGQVAP